MTFLEKLSTLTDSEFIKRNVIYIPQDPYVARDMTVKELLCYPYSVSHTTDVEAIQVLSIILKFPLNGEIISKLNERSDYCFKLSGGEKQRIQIGKIFLE